MNKKLKKLLLALIGISLCAVMGSVLVHDACVACNQIAAFAKDAATKAPLAASSNAGYSDSFQVTCGTSPTKINSKKGQLSYMCQVPSGGTDVIVGDSTVTATTGPSYAAGKEFGGNVREEYCIVSSGTQAINCRAQTVSQ